MFRKLCTILAALSIAMFLLSPAVAERGAKVVKKDTKQASAVDTGYYALIIGNNNYKYLPKLKTAANDARAVEKMLKEKYGFRTKLLIDATRDDILDGLNELRESMGSRESILIYYAGHGEYDKTVDKAYWLPVDARKDRTTNWIIADDITSNIKRVSSKHILLVSDSCYSGTLSRAATAELSSKSEHDEYIRKMLDRPSRTLMASGGNEPVSDSGGGGNNSVFAAALIKALGEADKSQFTADELFHGRVRAIVAGKSDQVPEYHDIKNSGHEGGDFVFQLAKAMTPELYNSAVPSGSVKVSEESKKLQEERERLRKEREEFEQAKALMAEKKSLEEERQKFEKEKQKIAMAPRPQSGKRFSLDGGVIEDSKLGLQWAPAPDRVMTHYEAEKYAQNLSLSGGGWRLPTRAELKSLYDTSKSGNADPVFGVGGKFVWTSELEGSSSAWVFFFNTGDEDTLTRAGSFNFYRVLAVRSRR
jgi:uncharacterized caspase-like protein